MRPGIAGTARAAVPADRPDLAATVAAAQRGDEHAFRVIYRDVQPRLLRYLRAMVGDDAEDVASEAWLQVTRDLAGFRGDSDGFRGWAATIARHRAMDHQRRHRRRPQPAATSLDDLGDLAARNDTAESALDAVSTEAAIAMIAELPRDQAEAVMLRVVMGLDAESAGRVLGKKRRRPDGRLPGPAAPGRPPRTPTRRTGYPQQPAARRWAAAVRSDSRGVVTRTRTLTLKDVR